VNAFIFVSILVLYHLVQEHVKEGYVVHFITATYTFHFQLLYTYMSLVCVPMFLQEGELKKLCACIWCCECINNEFDDS
jgi:hypothetical protein